MTITIHQTEGEYRVIEHPTMGYSVQKFVKPLPFGKGFWQQVSPWYMRKGKAISRMNKKNK